MSTTKNEQYHILSPEWLRTNPLPEGDVFYRTKGYTHWCEFDRSFHRTDLLVTAQLNEYEFSTYRTDLPPEAYITPPTDTTGRGREGETQETDAEIDALETLDRNAAWVGLKRFARQLERQRDAALAQVEALRRDGERLDWLEKNAAKELKIDNDGTYVQLDRWHRKYITAHSWTEPTLRAAIDSAQRQEGR